MALREAEGLAGQLAKGEAPGAVEQDVVDGVAGAATDGAKPGVGEFPRRKGVGGAIALDVAFDTEDPGTVLPVIAGLRAADETGRPGWVIVNRTPVPADIAADIWSRPAIHVERLVDCVGGARSVRHVGSQC